MKLDWVLRRLLVLSAALLLATAAPRRHAEVSDMPFTLTSTDFQDGGPMPAEVTSDGIDRSPQLAWTGTPGGTKSLALIVEDPDAPDPAHPQRIWVHWVLYDLPPSAGQLPAGAGSEASGALPQGTKDGLNDWRRTGYSGPNPPIGRHRYFFRLRALDAVLPDLGRPDKHRLEAAMKGHVLAEATLMGTYEKARR